MLGSSQSSGLWTPTSAGSLLSGAEDVLNSLRSLLNAEPTNAKEHDENSVKNSNTATSSKTNQRKSLRFCNLSLVRKESKILQLNTTLVKSISAQLTNHEKTLSILESLKLVELKQHASLLHLSFENISSIYHQLCVLCENKPTQTIKTIFHNLEDDFKSIYKPIEERIRRQENIL